ncbi:MAG: hypothetical protein ABI740_02950 [Alphaproteobacteria bacterium]
MRLTLCGLLLVAGLAGCSSAQPNKVNTKSDEKSVELMMSGRMKGKALDAALREAQKHPLGSAQNPVRADLNIGEHAYLNRLRCSDGVRPTYERPTTPGPGLYGSNVDTYDVLCANGEPKHTVVIMDGFFPGYIEKRSVEGYTIEAP